MKDFIKLAACKGHEPRPKSYRMYSRSALIARMMGDRGLPRVLWGPVGMGRSALARQYAQVVFEYRHVFWLDCSSPCFLRDLDDGKLVNAVFDADPEAALVVLDDVPALSAERSRALARVYRELHGGRCEVVVTCAPHALAAVTAGTECLVLGPRDLLLTDAELAAQETQKGAMAVPVHEFAHIPAIGWPGRDVNDYSECLLEVLKDPTLPTAELSALMAAVTMGGGTLEALAGVGGPDAEAMERLAAWYPFLAVDETTGTFSTVRCPVKDIVKAIRSRLADVAFHLGFPSENEALYRLASLLLVLGNGRRACQVADVIPHALGRARWLQEHRIALLDGLWLEDGIRVYAGVGTNLRRAQGVHQLHLFQAVRMMALGQTEAAVKLLDTLEAMTSCTPQGRLLAAMLRMALNGRPGPLDKVEEVPALDPVVEWLWACDRAGGLDGEELCRVFDRLCGGVQPDDPSALLAALCVTIAAKACGTLHPVADRETLEWLSCVEARMARALETWGAGALTPDGHLRFVPWVFASSLRTLAGHGLPPVELSSCLGAALVRTESALHTQAENLHVALKAQQAGGAVLSFPGRVNGSYPSRQAAQDDQIPLLHIQMMGALEFRINGKVVEHDCFTRQKVKVLAVMLALTLGQEVPRDRLIQEMWPASFQDVAVRSFYSLWSKLRRGLSDDRGKCPYLLRSQTGFRFDPRYVRSDLSRMEELCRLFQLGRVDVVTWPELLQEFQTINRGDILPTEQDSATIVSVREHYHRIKVDAMVTGSMRLLQVGEPQLALMFANYAYRLEKMREDVYLVLMEAQAACCQRTNAVQTYLACRHMLAEGLGLDPSPRITQVYLDIISVDDSLAV